MENKPASKSQISVPSAIIVAGVLIMIGILGTRGGSGISTPKTLSEQVGVSNASLQACIEGTDDEALNARIVQSVDKAMSPYPREQRGTPYTIVIGQNGARTDIRGQETYENTKKIVDDALLGKATIPYTGNVVLSEPGDHVMGNPNAKVTIIEYSDFECPYCKGYHPVLERIVKENPDTAWIYRHYPLHQHSFAMLTAADCVAKLKGEDAFWKYADLLFGLMDKKDTVSGQL